MPHTKTLQQYVYQSLIIAVIAIGFTAMPFATTLLSAPTAQASSHVVNTDTNDVFSSIQAAIDSASTTDGHTIEVDSGTYNGDIEVDKQLTINGPNKSTVGSSSSRANEAVINAGSDSGFNIKTASTTIAGFKIEGSNEDSGEAGVWIRSGAGADNATVKNNLIDGFYAAIQVSANEATVSGNKVSDVEVGVGQGASSNPTNSVIDNNHITARAQGVSGWKAEGMQVTSNTITIPDESSEFEDNERGIDASAPEAVIEDNTIDVSTEDMTAVLLQDGASNAKVRDNTMTGPGLNTDGKSAVEMQQGVQTPLIENNDISGFKGGMQLRGEADVRGNTISDVYFGVGQGSGMDSSNLPIENVIIENNEINAAAQGISGWKSKGLRVLENDITVSGTSQGGFAGNERGVDVSRSGARVEKNTIESPNKALLVEGGASNLQIRFNNLYSADYGLSATTASAYSSSSKLTAERNYWNSSDGPSGAAGQGSTGGSQVSENVDYEPWLCDEYDGGEFSATTSADGCGEAEDIDAEYGTEDDPYTGKVEICHATKSGNNPYVSQSPNANSVFSQGHDEHQDDQDIIPPFYYDDGGETKLYEGNNWNDENKAVWENDCRAPEDEPEDPEGGTIDGLKFEDENRDGEPDGEGSGLPGFEIVAYGENNLVDTLKINSSEEAGATTTALQTGNRYLIEVSGTYQFSNDSSEVADAEYYSRSNFASGTIQDFSNDSTRDDRTLDVVINDENIDWGSYSGDHTYRTITVASSGSANLRVFEEASDQYPDNTGTTTARIYDVTNYSTTTDQSGNFSLSVPTGDYDVIEIQQDGYVQTFPSDGVCEAVVDQEEDSPFCYFGNYDTEDEQDQENEEPEEEDPEEEDPDNEEPNSNASDGGGGGGGALAPAPDGGNVLGEQDNDEGGSSDNDEGDGSGDESDDPALWGDLADALRELSKSLGRGGEDVTPQPDVAGVQDTTSPGLPNTGDGSLAR